MAASFITFVSCLRVEAIDELVNDSPDGPADAHTLLGRLRILLGDVSADIDQLGRRFDRMRLNPCQFPFKGTDVIRALDFGEELFSHSPSPPS